MKKILALLVIAPLLISCSGKKSEEINEAWIKDTNGFDILMGQFAHNIENIWGLNEVLIAGPKDYVKYTDQYQTRSHINFDTGAITIETIATTDPAAHLRQAIISTLLMGDDPGSIDLIPTPTISRSAKSRSCMARCWITKARRSAGNGARRTSPIICCRPSCKNAPPACT